ncbi:MAG: homoserine dehydrogenase [Trueperaceae bacterium]|nr:homoserine dehydrogenase [Trueperaceae bacterium]
MNLFRVALVGFGTVGQGFARILRDHGEALRSRHGLNVRITAVSDVRRGSLHDPEGLDLDALLAAVEAGGTLAGVSARDRDWDALTTIQGAEADVMAELAFTDLDSGEPALTHVRAALTRGLHVITTNKGPIALAYPELADLARRHGVRLESEGTVMSGTPALHLGTELLAVANVTRIEGVLNGTSNYVLTRMEAGLDFAAALGEAQAKGYAEADPSGDVDGIDAAGKVVILANRVMGAELRMADVPREGIRALTPERVAEAAEVHERWKLLGRVRRDADGSVRADVAPRRLSATHPLASVSGASNAVTFTTDLLGDVTLVGPGAGRLETGYALIEDLLALQRHHGGTRA